jgi:DNA repair exonuclease SbcCD ATPase subunit
MDLLCHKSFVEHHKSVDEQCLDLIKRLEAAENRSQEHLNAHMQSFGALAKISAMTDLEGEVDDYGDVVASVERLRKRLEEAESQVKAWQEIADVKDTPCCPSCGRIRYCGEDCGDRAALAPDDSGRET